MSSSQISRKNKDIERREMKVRRPLDELFDNVRQEIEDTFFAPFINPPRSTGMPGFVDSIETRIPLWDIIEKEDRYLISLEISGISKDKIEVKATDEHTTISGIKEKKK